MRDPVYYELLQALPGIKAGEIVAYSHHSIDPLWHVGPFTFPEDYPERYPDWFRPVSRAEHEQRCRESLTSFTEERGYAYEQVASVLDVLNTPTPADGGR